MRIRILFSILILAGCTSASKRSSRAPAYSVKSYGVEENLALPQFDDAMLIARSGRANTVADFLGELKSKFPMYLDVYTLMYDSFSLQQASFENPRVILTGLGNFVMTFNGRPDQAGYGEFETMEYSRQNGFKFRQIKFVKESGGVGLPPEEIDNALSTSWVHVSKPNLPKCTACHGERPARPIWEDYFVWPGAYGSEDDRAFLIGFSKKVRASLGKAMNLKSENIDPETNSLAKFHAARAANPRYAQLGGFESIVQKSGSYGFGAEPHPNFFLSRTFVKASLEQLAKKISETPAVHARVPEILYALQCDDGSDLPQMSPRVISMNMELVARMKRSFGTALDLGRVTLDDEKFDISRFNIESFARSPKRKNIAAVIRRTQKQFPKASLYEQLATAAITGTSAMDLSRMEKALAAGGIDLADYATNLRRVPNFVTLYSPVSEFVEDIVDFIEPKLPSVKWGDYVDRRNPNACRLLKSRISP